MNAHNIPAGIYADVKHHTYHREWTDIISNSYLGKLAQCPAKAKIVESDTPALRFGRALHSFVLDQDQWIREFVVVPNDPVFLKNKNSNEYKAAYAEFAAHNIGKEIVSRDDYQTITDMYFALMGNPAVREYLSGGTQESTVVWQDDETGIWCKNRPDQVPAGDHGIVLDLKTTRNAAEHPFQSAIVTYGYARQGAMALTGLSQVTGKVHDLFGLIAVETEPPYRTEIYVLDDDFLRHGYSEFKRLLRIEKRCREQNYWPNYAPTDLMNLRHVSPKTMLKPGYLSVMENIPEEER